MCYNYQKPSRRKLEHYSTYRIAPQLDLEQADILGFTYPEAPVLFDSEPDLITSGKWGLIPFWAKNTDIAKNTLNARIETIKEKPSFRNAVKNRCLIFASGFYEWQWLDPKGKEKQKYFIQLAGREVFTFAGIYSIWNDTPTFSIVTTEANELMAEIHNNKKRMPVILTEETENAWLTGLDTADFARPVVDLVAEKV